MAFVNTKKSSVNTDREKELKAFDETKLGVKGLVDAGTLLKLPDIFIRPSDELSEESKYPRTQLKVPVVDFLGIENSHRRKQIVAQVKLASEEWGFFQVVNHGIPLSVLNGMIEGIRLFHEQDFETKKQLYSYDLKKKVRFNSNYDLYQSQAANWRDTLTLTVASDPIDAHEVPESCRDTSIEYIKHVLKLGDTLIELLTEALGLKADHLNAMDCTKGHNIFCGSYYPACPDPELTLGISKHTVSTFFTVLLQDHVGGLQVLHGNGWVDIEPIVGGLVVNIGDLFQIVSNDKFKSVVHRALVNSVEARISVPCFFSGSMVETIEYGPVKELISEENPPIYRSFKASDYMEKFFSKPLDGKELRDLFKL